MSITTNIEYRVMKRHIPTDKELKDTAFVIYGLFTLLVALVATGILG